MPRERGPRWRSRTTLLVLAAFLLPLALLLVTSGLPAIAFTYSVLFVEGDLIVYLILERRRSTAGGRQFGDENAPTANRVFLNADRVEGLTATIRWAERGSDFARKELAQSVATILAHSRSVSYDTDDYLARGGLAEAIGSVVYPYRDDLVVKSGLEAAGVVPVSRPGSGSGHAQYLADLEKAVTELEREIDTTGGA